MIEEALIWIVGITILAGFTVKLIMDDKRNTSPIKSNGELK